MGCRERSCEREEPGWQVNESRSPRAQCSGCAGYTLCKCEAGNGQVASDGMAQETHIQAHVLVTVSPLSPSTMFIHTGSAINQSYYRITFSSSASHQRQPCRIPVSVLFCVHACTLMTVHWQHHQDSLRPVRAFSNHETRFPPNIPFNAQRQLLTSKWAPFLSTGWRLTLYLSTSGKNTQQCQK